MFKFEKKKSYFAVFFEFWSSSALLQFYLLIFYSAGNIKWSSYPLLFINQLKYGHS